MNVIFDFNGTLFPDSDINEWAWRQTIKELSEDRINFDEEYPKYKSVRNYEFLKQMFIKLDKPLIEEEINYWAKRKETEYYQKYCVEHNRKELTKGTEDLLNYLKGNNISINLCTSSIIENVNFYFDYIGMNRWFDVNKIVYDDGNYINKVEMYKDAARNIGSDIKDCLVFEDSYKSILEAIEAGCQNVIVVNNKNISDLKEIKQKINNIEEFDKSLLWKKY